MTTDAYAPSAVGERIRELCRQFRLPTLAAETVSRFSDAGHAAALPTLVGGAGTGSRRQAHTESGQAQEDIEDSPPARRGTPSSTNERQSS